MANRKTISFGVSEETFNLIKSNVPNGTCDEALLLAMFEAYQNKDNVHITAEEQEFVLFRDRLAGLLQCDETIDSVCDSVIDLLNDNANLRKIPTVEAPVVASICELLQIESILLAPDAIKELIRIQSEPVVFEGIQILAHPFILELLEVTCEKLTTKFGREVTPAMVLQDMFTRYTLEQLNEWFYPFVLREPAIMAIAKKHYPTIESYSQLKKLVCGHE